MFKGFIFFFFLLLTQTVFAGTTIGENGISFSRPILDKTSFDAQSRNDVYVQAHFSPTFSETDKRTKVAVSLGYYFSGTTNPEDRWNFFSISVDATGYSGNKGDLFQPYVGGGIGLYYYGPRNEGSFRVDGQFPNYYGVNKDSLSLPDIVIRPYLFAGIRLDFQNVYLDFEYMSTYGLFRNYSNGLQSMLKFELGIPIKTN